MVNELAPDIVTFSIHASESAYMDGAPGRLC
jgi:hypothetical protein